MNRYPMTVFWSDEDESWIGVAPDLPGCSAHGDSPAKALAELEVAVGLWLETAKAYGDPIPEPRHVATAA